MKDLEQAFVRHGNFPKKHYRTTSLIVRMLVVSIIVSVLLSVKLALSIHILAAMLFEIPFLILLLASYSVGIIDVLCGEEYLEIRRLKIFPPVRIAWSDIRDVKWEESR